MILKAGYEFKNRSEISAQLGGDIRKGIALSSKIAAIL